MQNTDGLKTSTSPAITFRGGLSSPFHRWFRLTPSFSPELVAEWLESRSSHVKPGLLDPFSGAGTTAIVAKSIGLDAVATEINPFLAFVGRTCTDWDVRGQTVADSRSDVLRTAEVALRTGARDVEVFADELGVAIPPIHNVQRWWRSDVLRELLALKWAIESQEESVKPFLNLAVAQIVYSSANITLGRLQIAFVDRGNESIEVLEPFSLAVDAMIEDLEAVEGKRSGNVQVSEGDATILDNIEDGSIGAVFTSPPYPNRYSYVWNTRPHLYLLDFFSTAREAAELDIQTIGGTWGSATSMHQKGVRELRPNVANSAGPVIEQLHEASTLMGNYVTKYFNDLDLHLEVLKPKLKPGSPVGYVVGNSETKGIMIETQDILGKLLVEHGFGNVDLNVLRKRNSGAGLTEVTVSAIL